MHDDSAPRVPPTPRAGRRSRAEDPPVEVAYAPPPENGEAPEASTLHAMSDEEVARFVRENRFAVLSLADAGHAWGVPLFYGVHGGEVYFQARPGTKTRFLMRTAEACLTVCRSMEGGEWASANVVGRVERVDRLDEGARRALEGVPGPSDWDETTRPEEGRDGTETFRLGMSRRSGRYSRPPEGKTGDRDVAWGV